MARQECELTRGGDGIHIYRHSHQSESNSIVPNLPAIAAHLAAACLAAVNHVLHRQVGGGPGAAALQGQEWHEQGQEPQSSRRVHHARRVMAGRLREPPTYSTQ